MGWSVVIMKGNNEQEPMLIIKIIEIPNSNLIRQLLLQ